MAAPTPEMEKAAHLAAERIRLMIIEMLVANETGHGYEAAIKLLSPYELKPVKRTETEGRSVGVARGQMTAIERVG